jgi:hypothetical protein
MPLNDRGLDLLNADVTQDEEIAQFRSYYARAYGGAVPAFEFWFEYRPDMVKRQRLVTIMSERGEARKHPLIGLLGALHRYVTVGYAEGVTYQIQNCRSNGATKGNVLDTIAIAHVHGSLRTTSMIVGAARAALDDWNNDTSADRDPFPAAWEFDAKAFDSGLDFSVEDMSKEEMARLEAWHLQNGGEVPPYVTFMETWRPNLLKAHRNQLEHAIAFDLPKQMMAYLKIYFEVMQGNPQGIREGVLLARSFGISKDGVLDAIFRPFGHVGSAPLGAVEASVGDILIAW